MGAFDQTVTNFQEKPVSDDLNQNGSDSRRTFLEILRTFFLAHASSVFAAATGNAPQSGFLADSFFVSPSAGTTIQVQPGFGFLYDTLRTASAIGGVDAVDDLSPYHPLYLSAAQPIGIPSPPTAGNERWDLIEVNLDRRYAAQQSRQIFNPSIGDYNPPGLVNKTLTFDMSGDMGIVAFNVASTTGIGYKTGQSATIGTAVAPAVTSGYTPVALVYVPSGLVTVAQSNIIDLRQLLDTSRTGGFTMTQTSGSPDTVASGSNPALPAGVRVAAKALGNALAGVRVYFFGGSTPQASPPWPTVVAAGTGSLLINLLAQISTTNSSKYACNLSAPTQGNLSSGDATTLQGLGYAVCPGQPYTSVDLTPENLAGSAPTSLAYNVHASIRCQ